MNRQQSKASMSFDDMSRLYLRLFRLIAILPFEGKDFAFLGTRIITVYLLCTSVISWSMLVVYLIIGNNVELGSVYLGVLVVGGNYRYYSVIWRRQKFATLIGECRSLWDLCDESGRQNVISFERKIRMVCQLFVGSSIFMNILFPVNAIMTRLPPLEPNGTELRVLSFDFYTDESYKVLGYWPSFALQLLVMQNNIIYGMTCDFSIPFFIMICSGYFRHVSERIMLTRCRDDKLLDDHELIYYIKFHQRLLKLCEDLEKFARTMLLSQLLCTGYNMSLILIELVSSHPGKYKHLSTLGILIGQLFMIEWAPDHIFKESEGVSFAAYSSFSQWIKDTRNSKRLLMLMIRSGSRPVQFTAGGYVNLSLENFGAVVKGAFSFFMILRKLDL